MNDIKQTLTNPLTYLVVLAIVAVGAIISRMVAPTLLVDWDSLTRRGYWRWSGQSGRFTFPGAGLVIGGGEFRGRSGWMLRISADGDTLRFFLRNPITQAEKEIHTENV